MRPEDGAGKRRLAGGRQDLRAGHAGERGALAEEGQRGEQPLDAGRIEATDLRDVVGLEEDGAGRRRLAGRGRPRCALVEARVLEPPPGEEVLVRVDDAV